jgi:putative transcriptional regulator
MTTEKPYHYKECGLDYVYLLDGIIRKDTPHGMGVAIVDADALHHAIARHVVTSPRAIGGQEVRFLRSVLRLSQTAFGKVVGVDRSTVARWEGEPHKPLEEIAQTAIRYTYAAESDHHSVIRQVMDLRRAEDDADADQHQKELKKQRVALSSKNGWHRAA